jgi:hypothetical protein
MDKTNTTDGKVKFTIGDVGGAYWEDLSYGGTDYAGMNYGWPDWEGPCRKDSFTDCPIPDSKSNSIEPFHYYQHRTKREGGAVAGQVFVPSDANWYVPYSIVRCKQKNWCYCIFCYLFLLSCLFQIQITHIASHRIHSLLFLFSTQWNSTQHNTTQL